MVTGYYSMVHEAYINQLSFSWTLYNTWI